MSCYLINGITSLGEWCDWLDPFRYLSTWSFSMLLLLFSWLIHVPMTMRLRNSRILEEHLVCYQTSQCNWVIIKMLYRYLQRCLLGWHRSRFLSLWVSERYLWALSVMHIIISLASNATNELVAGWCITEWVKRLAGNKIELGMKIPTIESWANNIPMTKGMMYVVIAVWPIKIFVEYVGTNMSIQVPLLVIDQRCVSIMST